MGRYSGFRWDKIYIGTIGFAQLGNQTYETKIKIEREVINAFYFRTEELRVPKQFSVRARFSWDLYSHDFGPYWDFSIVFDRDTVEEWEESTDDVDMLKHEEFWDWANKCEIALRNHEEELTQWCEQLYQKTITMEVIHRNLDNRNEELKAV